MKYDELMRQIELLRGQLMRWDLDAGAASEPGEILEETREQLSAALEELHVASEELKAQNEELLASRQEIEAEQRRYRDLFDFAPDGYLVTDPEGTIQEANRAAAAMLGVRQDLLVGKPLVLFVAGGDQGKFFDQLAQRRAGAPRVLHFEVTIRPRQGAPFPTAITVGPVRDAAGKVTGLRWLLRDITTLKQAEEALRRTNEELERRVQERTAELAQANDALRAEVDERKRAEERIGWLASFPEMSPSPVFEADETGHVRYANPAALHIVPAILTAGCEHPWLAELPSILTALQREGRTSCSREVAAGDAWYHQILFAVPGGRVLRSYAIDITERKRAEDVLRRYELLAQQARDIVLFIRRDGRILEANRAAVEAYGYARDELLGLTIQDLRAPETRSLTEEQMAQADAKGILFETVHRRKDGTEFPVEVSSRGTTLGETRLLLSIIRDITERRRAEAALRGAHDALVARLEERTRDLSGTSQTRHGGVIQGIEAEAEIRRLGRLLERRAGELAALDKAGRALVTSLDPEAVLQLLIREVRDLLGAEGAAFQQYDPQTDQLLFIAAEGGGLDVLVGQRMPATCGITGWVFRERQAALVQDVRKDPRFYTGLFGLTEVPLASLIAVPLISKGGVIGVLGAVNNNVSRSFTEEDLQILAAIANAAAVAIENARLHAEEQTRRRQLESVRDVTTEITRELDLAKVLEIITHRAVELVGAGAGTVWLWDEEEQVLVPRARLHSGEDWINNRRLRLGEGVAGVVAERRQGLIVNDYRRWPHALPYVLERSSLTAILAQPLLYRDWLLGVLVADNEGTGRTFSTEDAALLALLASHAAIAIQNARLFEEVRAGRDRLERLSRRLVEVQEAERRHIARELHDEVGQSLTGLKLLMDMSARSPEDLWKENRADAQALVNDLLTQVRELSLELRPAMLDDLGLLPSLVWYLERYRVRTTVQVLFQHAGVEGRRFPPELETAAYRIVQEALTNVARHAGVREATVRVWVNQETLGVQIQDQGVGFNLEAAMAAHVSSGLAGMRERTTLLGGWLTVESAPGAGTSVTAEFSLGGKASDG